MTSYPLSDAAAAVNDAARHAGNPLRLAKQSVALKTAGFAGVYLVMTGFFSALVLFGSGKMPRFSWGLAIPVVIPLVLLAVFLRRMTHGVREIRRWQRILREGTPVEATVLRVAKACEHVTYRLQISGWVISYRYTDPRKQIEREGNSAHLPKRWARQWNQGDRGIVFLDPKDARASVWTGERVEAKRHAGNQ